MFVLQLSHLIIDELIKMNELIIMFNGAYFLKMVALGLALLQYEGREFESQLQQAFSAWSKYALYICGFLSATVSFPPLK